MIKEAFMEKMRFVPYEEAKKIISDIVEMEHPTEDGKRIFNVYDQAGKPICWFDAEEVEAEVDAREFEDIKEHILHLIPDWAT